MQQTYLEILGRNKPILEKDFLSNFDQIKNTISNSRFLVIGGAGSIGRAVTKEIFKLEPKVLHVVDISENSNVELVRDIRSSIGYIKGDFKTFSLDCGSREYELLTSHQSYDYVLNLSALKHVRSEQDPYTLLRLIEVNIFNTLKTIKIAQKSRAKKYFCVSTDKATNPVNMMGASKRIMELFLMSYEDQMKISTARFANVAFSDGSLLQSFQQRIDKGQPIVAPSDIERYFITPEESGKLCLISTILGNNRDIFFPKLSEELKLTKFSDIALRFLEKKRMKPVLCSSESEARNIAEDMNPLSTKEWPCYFFKSDTTGEKGFEEFFTETEETDFDSYEELGIIKNKKFTDTQTLQSFIEKVNQIKKSEGVEREIIIDLFKQTLKNFNHIETGKFLGEKM